MNKNSEVIYGISPITEHDIYLFREGTHFRLYEKLGSHVMKSDGADGVFFGVWAPNAQKVSVMGDFNGWDRDTHVLSPRWDGSGIWEGFIPGIGKGTVYKYFIVSKNNGITLEKRDPFAFHSEIPPATASIVWDLEHEWSDFEWMQNRKRANSLNGPMSVYEMHLGSWRRDPEEPERLLSYNEISGQLISYLKEMNYTHVEFLPVMEHPFYGSWGYQTLGYFSPTSRYGLPQELMGLIEELHNNGLGVLFDWVPSHFPSDGHGLAYFDGTNLFEHSDPRQGYHPDWKSYIFNYGRNETRSFLISSAIFWFDKYHIDGIRVDAVASMLYLDYSRKDGEWIANEYGGRENIDAINFIKSLNTEVYARYPDVQMIAEESTAWPMVSRPVDLGGLGFGIKWNMGWMHDTLVYISKEPVHRKFHHSQLIFSLWYAFTENFMLSLSHDEVVHGKGSLIRKMSGDDWQKFANLRLLYGFMYGHPGKKLLFMGQEFGQWREWDHDTSLDWHLLGLEAHRKLQRWVKELNHFYKTEPAMHAKDFGADGFEWVSCDDWARGVVSFLRKSDDPSETVLVVCNFTPVVRTNYKLGVSRGGVWEECLNSDAGVYGGSGQGNLGKVEAAPLPTHGRYYSLSLVIPPLGVVFMKRKTE